jgi:hypothetical protein
LNAMMHELIVWEQRRQRCGAPALPSHLRWHVQLAAARNITDVPAFEP